MNSRLARIAVDLTPVLPGGDNGGAKIFVLELLRRLSELAPETEFILLTHSRSHDELRTLDRPNMRRLIAVREEGGGASRLESSLRRVKALLGRISPFIPGRVRRVLSGAVQRVRQHSHGSDAATLVRELDAGLVFCPFTAPTFADPEIPAICTIYDLQFKTYPQFFAADEARHREYVFEEACRLGTGLAAISDYSRMSAIGHGKLDPARIRTIYLRMSQRTSAVQGDAAILERLCLVRGEYVVYPANFWKHKNHEMLLSAFGIACRNGLRPDLKLVCTGAPGDRQRFLAAAAGAMGLETRICFPGFVSDAEFAALLANSAGVVFPSLYEGFGLPVIEAMSLGIPVACSNLTSLPEVAADAALLFDPRRPFEIADALVRLTEDADLRAFLIERGRRRAEEFSDSRRMAVEYLSLFVDACAAKTGESVLVGAYADGWTGRRLRVRVGPASAPQALAIQLAAPGWLPQPRLTIQTSKAGVKTGPPVLLERGRDTVLQLDIGPDGGSIEVGISPTFVPADAGLGEDRRELSAMLQRCTITRSDREVVELFASSAQP